MVWKRSAKNAQLTPTEKGAKFSLVVYVYPDGHGNLTGKGIDHPVNDGEQAIAAFADLWRSMKLSAAKIQREKAKAKAL
jgi:hypothetical protein